MTRAHLGEFSHQAQGQHQGKNPDKQEAVKRVLPRKRRVLDALAAPLRVEHVLDGVHQGHVAELGEQAALVQLAQFVALLAEQVRGRVAHAAHVGVFVGVEERRHFGVPQLVGLAAQVQAQGIHPGYLAVEQAVVQVAQVFVVGQPVAGHGLHEVKHPDGPRPAHVHDGAPQLAPLPKPVVAAVALEPDVEGHRGAQRGHATPRNVNPAHVPELVHQTDKRVIKSKEQQAAPRHAPDDPEAKIFPNVHAK